MAQGLKPKDVKQLDVIDRLINNGQLEEALHQSLAFTQKRAQLPEAWEQLAEIGHVLGNPYFVWSAMRQLCQLVPQEASYRYNLVVTELQMGFVFLPRQAVDIYLKRFPNGPFIQQINEMKQMLDQAIQRLIDQGDVPADVNISDMALFETGNLLIKHGEVTEGRQISLQAAKKLPDNPEPLNNISVSYLSEGNLPKALQTIEEVLAVHPDNIFARSSQVQALVRLGRADEARALLAGFHQATPDNRDYWLKIMEACAFAHEHQMLIDVYERAHKQLKKDDLADIAYMHHLAGAASAFLGDARKAKANWKAALKADPHNETTSENLREFQTFGPWYFPLANWLPRSWVEEFVRTAERVIRRGKGLKSQDIERFLAKAPGFQPTLSLLLERGDPESVDFVLRFAQYYPVPGLVEFATGRRGTDAQRRQATQLAVEHGLLSRTEPVTLILGGKPTPVTLLTFAVYTETVESDNPLPDAVQAHLYAAHEAWLEQDYEATLAEAEQGLALLPGVPALLNHQANALYMLNRHAEADAINRKLAEDQPDYLFVRVAMANICIREGNLDEADRWIKPLLQHERLHISEFRALALISISYWRAKGELEVASHWIQMLDEIDPDSVPDEWRTTASILDRLKRLRNRKS